MEKLSKLVCTKLPWLPARDEDPVILSTRLDSQVQFPEEATEEPPAASNLPPIPFPEARTLFTRLTHYFGAQGTEPRNCLVASMIPPAFTGLLMSRRIVDSELLGTPHFFFITEDLRFSAWSAPSRQFRLRRWFTGAPSPDHLHFLTQLQAKIQGESFHEEQFHFCDCAFYAHLPAFNLLRYDSFIPQATQQLEFSMRPLHAAKDGSPMTGFYECTIPCQQPPEACLRQAQLAAQQIQEIELNARKRLLKYHSLAIYQRLKEYYEALRTHLGNLPEMAALNAISNLLLGTDLGLMPSYHPSIFKLLVSLTDEKGIAFMLHTTQAAQIRAARGKIIAKCLHDLQNPA